jgi:hypothetical protein
MRRKRIPYGTKLPVRFSQAELDDIREHTFADSDLVSYAIVEGKKLHVDLSLDDIDELQGFVAAEANHTGDAKLRKRLDKLFERLQQFLDKYNDQRDL